MVFKYDDYLSGTLTWISNVMMFYCSRHDFYFRVPRIELMFVFVIILPVICILK